MTRMRPCSAHVKWALCLGMLVVLWTSFGTLVLRGWFSWLVLDTGDRRAVEVVEHSSTHGKPSKVDLGPLSDCGTDIVDIKVITEVVGEMSSSTAVRAISSLALHQKMFLYALTVQFKQSGITEAGFGEVRIRSHSGCCW